VEVDVVDHLATLGSAVHGNPISTLAEAESFAESPGDQQTPPEHFAVSGLGSHERGNVALGNDEDMHRRLRIDVLEGEDVVVLVLDVGRALPRNNPTERAVRHTYTPGKRLGTVLYNSLSQTSGRSAVMGTCPKCKLRIRKNGNHIKLGTTWYHKSCPGRATAKSKLSRAAST
jgi:hypothetical protein